MQKKYVQSQRGFTLVELIIVVAIIGLLAAALFVAIDPAKRIGDTRDSRRYSDMTSILNAILTYTVDTTTLPTAVSGMAADVYRIITQDSTDNIQCNRLGADASRQGVALRTELTDKYLATIPTDPRITTPTTSTQYYIKRSSNNRITIGSCENTVGSGGTLATQEVSR